MNATASNEVESGLISTDANQQNVAKTPNTNCRVVIGAVSFDNLCFSNIVEKFFIKSLFVFG